MESVLNEKGVFLWGDENVLELDGSGGPTHCECTQCHSTVYFNMVNFTSSEFRLNFFYFILSRCKNLLRPFCR